MASHRGDSVNMTGTRARQLPIIPLSDAPPLSAGELASVDAGRLTTNRLDLQDNDLSDVLVSFYAAVADDPLLAPYFASLDMSTHMPRIVAFWSTILFHTGRYSGNAFRPHLSMPGLTSRAFRVLGGDAGAHAGRSLRRRERGAYERLGAADRAQHAVTARSHAFDGLASKDSGVSLDAVDRRRESA